MHGMPLRPLGMQPWLHGVKLAMQTPYVRVMHQRQVGWHPGHIHSYACQLFLPL